MLKNVAIPLMLAATEAEAQMAKEMVREAMEGDRAKFFAGLIADELKCHAEDATIAPKVQDVSDATAVLATARSDVADAKAADGPYGMAVAARTSTVALAVAAETGDAVANALDAYDTALELARNTAADYATKDRDFVIGEQAAADAATAAEDAAAELTLREEMNTAATQAVTDVVAQTVKEKLWMTWLYCELGALVTGVTVTGSWQDQVNATLGTANPKYCEVPAVLNSSDVQVRPAVRYYWVQGTSGSTDETQLLAEVEPTKDAAGDSQTWLKFNATKSKAIAEAALLDTGDAAYQGQSRNPTAQLQWAQGNFRVATWMAKQRAQEYAYVTKVAGNISDAKTQASDQLNSTKTDVATDDFNASLGITAANSAAKVWTLASAAADADSLAMGAARTESVADDNTGYEVSWLAETNSVLAWRTANIDGTDNAAYTWWVAAAPVSAALQVWVTNELSDGTEGIEVEATDGSDQGCDVSGSDWEDASGTPGDIAACRAACVAMNAAAILFDAKTTDTGSQNGGALWPKPDSSSAAEYCGAFSFASSACKLLKGAEAASATGASAPGSDICAKMTKAKGWSDAQVTYQTAYAAAVTNIGTKLTEMKTAAATQSALERTWVEAWFAIKYWAEVEKRLDAANSNDSDAPGKVINERKLALESGTVGTDYATKRDADAMLVTAESALSSKTTALAALQSTIDDATATIAELGTRIERAVGEIAELEALATAGGVSAPLNLAQIKRNQAYTDYYGTDGTNGAKGDADAAKTAADDAILVGGSLGAPRAAAQLAWDQAVAAADLAKQTLDTAIGTTELETLRSNVEDDTADWNAANAALDLLVAAVGNAETALKEAQEAEDDAVLACQTAAYDDYRTTLETAMIQRAQDLETIKALLDGQTVPAPGMAGARCEKAISNGTFRPQRGEMTCAEGNCCGAARVWMESGTTEDAGWRTIETCQALEATTYDYQPARAPMATTMPAKVSVNFTCIEGAKKLAAAASAVAAAVYMLA